MFIALLTLISALSISGVAIFYSVIGLATIFPGAFVPVVIMGSVLEVGKLIAASWLYRNWKQTRFLLKFYLATAVVVLSLITSMGIFGFLSKAHLEQNLAENTVVQRIQIINSKITSEETYIKRQTLVIERGKDVKHIKDYPTAWKNPWDFEYKGYLPKETTNKNPVVSRCYAFNEATEHFFVKDNEHPYKQVKPFDWIRGYQVGGKSLMWARQVQRWSKNEFISSSRDHKEAHLQIADSRSGNVSSIFKENVETYYESGVRGENWEVLFDSDEYIWYSEKENIPLIINLKLKFGSLNLELVEIN